MVLGGSVAVTGFITADVTPRDVGPTLTWGGRLSPTAHNVSWSEIQSRGGVVRGWVQRWLRQSEGERTVMVRDE